MYNYKLNDISFSSDRHKLFLLICSQNNLGETISSLEELSIPCLNIGQELASFVEQMDDYAYLGIEAYDFVRKLMDRSKIKIEASGNPVLAIHNLGILLEPALEIKAEKLLQEFSKTSALIIIWENLPDSPDILTWPSQKHNFSFDFTDTPLKQLQYAV